MQPLENKWALVTGSSRGIGRQIALGLARLRCNVIVHGRDAAHTAETLRLLDGCGVRTAAVGGGLDTPEGVEQLIRSVRAQAGEVDILYNNAAVLNAWLPVEQIGPAEWQRVFQINLFAVAALCGAFAPGMKQRGYGRIINLTSGIRDVPQLAAYSASKAALDKYSRDLAFSLAGTNVLVSTLDPGWLKTDLGGPNADHAVETVLPGALVPALLDDHGPNGRFYAAQDFKHLRA